MQVVRVKKENYFIANSEVVGDVFDDNEQVFCEIVDTLQYTKSAKKKAKKMLKLSSMDEGKLSVKNHANANSGSARTHQSNIFKE